MRSWIRELLPWALALAVAAPAAAQDEEEAEQSAEEASEEEPSPAPAPSEPLPMPGPGESLSDMPPPPWADVQDVPNPEFLDTTDRRITDERPPPSAEQVAALREMEAEVDRFTRTGRAYRDSVNSILVREYHRRRRERQAGYARQIREEERLQNEARDRAIALFEAFIRRYPNDPTYTPDAMFRLGELYYERASIQFQEQSAAGTLEGTTPDFSATVDLYRTLIQRFPDYRRIDGVYYLIGYCLNEMAELEEARLAWLNLVCANRYDYTGEPLEPEEEEEEEEGEDFDEEEHPALGLGEEEEEEAPFVDPYDGCTPVTPNARFVMEVWLRIGEYHFDYDFEDHALDRAISAYNKVLADPTDRNYNLALYKVAWAYYRASRYPEAIEHFGRLIDWSDEQLRRTGRAGTELRQEAVQYLGITFAYDDWNENQIPDDEEGMPRGIERVQNPDLLPQDRNWTSEIYFELGQVYFEEAKYPEAVEVWELALQRWPNHPRAPEITANIARAWQRHQEMEEALRWQGRLGEYREGSEWWNANMDHPVEQRQAEELAEGALINEAIRHHRSAQNLRQEAVREQSEQRLQEALREYDLAATAYRAYLDNYPNSPNAYELQYNLADALFWSEQYEEAARVYAAVRDSNLDDRFLSESARRVVESLHRLVQAAEQRGEFDVRDSPEETPEPTGTPPRVQPTEMPMLVQRLAQAREVYLARVPEAQDTEGVRAPYDYNNALLLYYYGYWPQARERFLRIYEERCSGPHANQTGQVAWDSLYNMAVAMNDTAEAERLSRDIQRRGCTFQPDGPTFESEEEREEYCEQEEHADEPICTAGNVITAARYQRALQLFEQAEATDGEEQRRLYEQSATLLVEAVNDEPNHPQAPIALLQAGLALERTQRFDSAGRLYQRVIDEVTPKLADAEGERETELEGILATAYFRLAYTANRFFDYERAVDNYRQIADSDRFERSDDEDMPERITDALINAARILEYQQDYRRAASYYQRAADRLTDPEAKRNALYRVAEMEFKSRDWRSAIGAMRSFIDRYRNDRAARELVVQAQYRIAQIREEQDARQSTQESALEDVVQIYDRVNGEPGSMAAEYAARSRFQLVDPELQDLESLAIDPGRQSNTEAFVNELNRQIQEGSTRTQEVSEGYEPIFQYRRPTWTIAALTRQGRAYEILARAVLNAEITMPTDLQRRIRGASQMVRDEVQFTFEDRVRQVLDAQVRPIECYAVVRYALAARAAQRGNIDNEYSREAIDRLQAYGDERIATCITQQRAQDESLEAYRPGEFARARRGQHMEMTPGVTAPALAEED
ncbi:MAG TPA: tetratricopeptide repeat protein [Sandaracinaceae bacterium LLY-WYZ-13_1]|nr:tetratricopeptide repeat protein [Sandaracinaceae bacterium LLY-WYZ-13_1]